MAQTQLASKVLIQNESIIKHGMNHIFNPTKKMLYATFFLGNTWDPVPFRTYPGLLQACPAAVAGQFGMVWLESTTTWF